jgi:hypothetical protein
MTDTMTKPDRTRPLNFDYLDPSDRVIPVIEEGDPLPTEAEPAEAARLEQLRQDAVRAIRTGRPLPRA